MLRERGLVEEAERLRAGQLPGMLAALRTPADTDETVEQRLAATFAAEAERVANAAVLAELLAPLLAEQTRLRPLEASAGSSSNPGFSSSTSSPVSPAKSAPRPVPGNIADFIDEMIAQERSPPRGRPATQRRAS